MKPNQTNDEKPEVVKVNKWDGSAVKNALDDAVRDVFTKKLNYHESFKLMDIRLLLCGVSVGVALFALVWDYIYPFPQSRSILIMCVVTYFILMGILTVYTAYVEKGIFAIVMAKDKANQTKHTIEATSYLAKYSDKYYLELTLKSGKSVRRGKMTASVAKFIDVNGVVIQELVDDEIVDVHNKLVPDKSG